MYSFLSKQQHKTYWPQSFECQFMERLVGDVRKEVISEISQIIFWSLIWSYYGFFMLTLNIETVGIIRHVLFFDKWKCLQFFPFGQSEFLKHSAVHFHRIEVSWKMLVYCPLLENKKLLPLVVLCTNESNILTFSNVNSDFMGKT